MSNRFKKRPIIVDADETWEEQASRQHRQIEEEVAASAAWSDLQVRMLDDRATEEFQEWSRRAYAQIERESRERQNQIERESQERMEQIEREFGRESQERERHWRGR